MISPELSLLSPEEFKRLEEAFKRRKTTRSFSRKNPKFNERMPWPKEYFELQPRSPGSTLGFTD